MSWWTLREVRDRPGALKEMWDGSGDSRGGPGQIVRPLDRSWTCWGTLGEVWDGSEDQ